MFVLSPENSFNWFWAILLIWVVLLYPKALINWEESRVRSLYIRSLTKHCWFNSFPHQKSGKDLITFSTYRQQLSSERTSKVVFYKKVSMGKFFSNLCKLPVFDMSFGRDSAWRYETGDISLRFADSCNIYSTAFLPANWDCEWGEWFFVGQTYLLLTDFRRKEKEKESKRFSLHFKCIPFLPFRKGRLSFLLRTWGNIVLVLLTLSLQNSNRSCQVINLFEL